MKENWLYKFLVAWFVVALIFSYLGFLRIYPPPFPQVVLVSLTICLILLYLFSVKFKAAVNDVPLKALLYFHLCRFVGLYFIYLYRQGRLPYEFAVPGGIGDTIVALAALMMLLVLQRRKLSRFWILAWNIYGLVDILYVVSTAVRMSLKQPTSMQELTVLPLALLITFIVPIIIASHIFLVSKFLVRQEM